MAVLKCKMCGGTLDVTEGMTVCECEYCGSKQTVPQLDDEKKINLFTRANRLRQANEFDKASGVYESIVTEFPEEAEAYWGLILCKYGIEYVDDPKTGRKIPTCHRSSFDSVMDDQNFDLVMEYSDPMSRAVYREESKAIEELRIGIIEVSSKEEPYDIFICYKETDAMGERTIDSVMAQDIYDMLTENKYRVFFACISLEDKIGTAYEPYIFAALNSARIMLAVGTDYEYYNAVWVKNEWSRFLAMMSKDKKKVLIPCHKGIDAYDMPKEFKHLQAQDMGKVGAMQDLLRGIKKILPKETAPVVQQVTQVVQGGANINTLLHRAFMFLEDGDWQSTDEYCKIVSIAAGDSHVVGLKSDGTVVTTGNKDVGACDVSDWKDIVAIDAGDNYTVGLKSDGTVVTTELPEERDVGQCDVSDWKGIVAISVNDDVTIGLKADGTVCVTGGIINYDGNKKAWHKEIVNKKEISDWNDIVSVKTYIGTSFVGVKSDGTVVSTSYNREAYDGWKLKTK